MKIEIPTTGQHPDYRAEIAGILRSSLTPGELTMGEQVKILSRQEPAAAVASGPLITTINDLVAVVTYYGLAWIFLLNAV